MNRNPSSCLFFFFNDTATTEISPLSLHDPLPIWAVAITRAPADTAIFTAACPNDDVAPRITTVCPADRKSTRLNSSHLVISYAVFCLKKKKHRLYTAILITYLPPDLTSSSISATH